MLLLSILLALVIDLLFGDPPNRFHPVVAMGTLIRWMASHAPAQGRTRQFLYGAFLMFTGLALSALPLFVLDAWLKPYPWLDVVVKAVLLKMVFSLRKLLEAGREVEIALLRDDLAEARRLVSWHLVSRKTSDLDQGHVISAAIESLAENLADSFVAPLLAFALGGLPLAWAYRFANTADAMIGYRNEKYEYLGKFAARLDDLLNWIPSRLSGILIVLAAVIVRSDLKNAWRVMIAQHAHTASPNAGWPMSAAAGALGVILEKIDHYCLDGGPHLPSVDNLHQARKIVFAAAVVAAFVTTLLCWR